MVYLVGAGPGDPELITLKGRRLLSEADVVIYDRLVGEEILDYARRGAELIYAGKKSTYHSRPQDEINALMVEKAGLGSMVVRLKGGDPSIFGRGGEEARFLKRAGVSFEIVPGVTAASGFSASSGIPLTDRRVSSAVTFIAGHTMQGRGIDDLPWRALSSLGHTLVFYMALTNMNAITERLIGGGLSVATPAAAAMSATTPGARIVRSTLGSIAEKALEAGLKAPVLLVVGDVAAPGGGS